MSYFGNYSERFTLVDIDGVILSEGEELVIREPERYSAQEFTLDRNEKYRTFLSEFSNAEVSNVAFDKVAYDSDNQSPFSFLLALKKAAGIDAKVNLRAYRTPKGGEEELK